MCNAGSVDFEGQKIQLGKNPGRESLQIFEAGKEALSEHEKGTFLPFGCAGRKARSGNYSAVVGTNTKFKNKANATESKQSNTLGTLYTNKIGFPNWVLRPCYKLYATSRGKCYRFFTFSESPINSAQWAKLIHNMTSIKEKPPSGESFPQTLQNLMKITTSFQTDQEVGEAYSLSTMKLIPTFNTVETLTEPTLWANCAQMPGICSTLNTMANFVAFISTKPAFGSKIRKW